MKLVKTLNQLNKENNFFSEVIRFGHYRILLSIEVAFGNVKHRARTRFAALGAGYMNLLWILIGSMRCLHLFWLATVITLVLVLQHSIENRSKSALKEKERTAEGV